MNRRSPNAITAIVFAREPEPGKTKTRLASRIGADHAAVLADAFLLDTLAKVAALGLPLVIAAATSRGVRKSGYFQHLASAYGAGLIDQSAGDLGARMAGALKRYAESGGAMLIGSDLPSLPSGHLKRAMGLMGDCNVVLGPALDGGYYLLGVRGAVPPIFHRMRWGKPDVLRETLGRLRAAHLGYALAPCWYDVDTADALTILGEHLSRRDLPGFPINRALPLGRRCPCPSTAKLLARLEIRPRC